MTEDDLTKQAELTLESCRKSGLTSVTAESCTGGLVSSSLVSISGSSDVVSCGFVTYSNEAKNALIGVSKDLLKSHGAVSREVAIAMAAGALEASGASVSISVTGVAGPTGGTADKPVGLVHMASSRNGHPTLHEHHQFDGDRTEVRRQSAMAALKLLQKQAEG